MVEKPTYKQLKQRILQLEKQLEKYTAPNSDKKYRILFEKSKDAILMIENEKFVDCNPSAVDMLGYTNKTELLQTHPSKLSPDKQADGQNSFVKAKKMMNLALKNGRHRFEWDHKRANGEIFPVEVLLTTISNRKDKRVIHTIWRDITTRKQIEKARQEEKETLSTILESTPHGITLIDYKGKYLYVNPYFTKITGYLLKDIPTKEEWFKKAYPDKIYQKKTSEIWKNDSNTLERGKVREFIINCKNGKSKYIEFRSTFLKDRKISVLTDITKQKQAKKELKLLNLKLEHDAAHDALTGAPNRRAIFDKLNYELIRANRKNSQLSIGLCDIDHFKFVNDRYGHQVGDDILCIFVKTIQSILRPYDFVGRYGGEEFLIIIPEHSESAEEGIYERVRAKIANQRMDTRSGKIGITISIGVVNIRGEEDANAMIAAADTALYKAKHNGRNQLAFGETIPVVEK
jgi:diguanylate cyclase (GGDEF)-like protein/PAS domain S-box-containing protein